MMLVSVALLLLLAFCGEVGVAVGGDGYHSASTIVRTFGERASFDQLALQIIVRTQRECAAIDKLAVDGAGCAFVSSKRPSSRSCRMFNSMEAMMISSGALSVRFQT